MRASLIRIALPALCLSALLAAAEQPVFETASAKRAERCAMQNSIDPARISLIGDPLIITLAEAYQVKANQVLGPSWLEADCFDIVATLPRGATRDQLPAMLRALLADRFKLVAHKETRPRSGYALAIDKNGVKFKESDPASPDARAGRIAFLASRRLAGCKGPMTMAVLARYLSGKLGAPVEDVTGLKGKYDIDVSWTPDPTVEKIGEFAAGPGGANLVNDAASLPSDRGNIFTALRDSLGLKLESRKQQVEVVVIDRVERVPTEN